MPNLANGNECTGCTACVNSCPKKCLEMKSDEHGFMHPVLSLLDKCIKCGICEKKCPVVHPVSIEEQKTVAFAAFSRDEDLRKESSSGGVFSELAKNVIQDAGIIYGAAYDEQFKVHHICITNVEELSKLRGAKYSQSELGNCFSEIKVHLQNNKKVLFSGTPCQVAGLKVYLGKQFDNLICVDFVCHGVPSPRVWERYVKYRTEKDYSGKLPIEINMRSKESGWTRYNYSTSFRYANQKCVSLKNSENTYMKLFVNDYINRKSCADCKFKGYNRTSDITLGDFWGIWDISSDMDDNKGTSLVLVHSERGENLFENISGNLILKEMTLEQASAQNPSLLVSSQAKPERNEIFKECELVSFDELDKLLFCKKRNLLSILRRLFHK